MGNLWEDSKDVEDPQSSGISLRFLEDLSPRLASKCMARLETELILFPDFWFWQTERSSFPKRVWGYPQNQLWFFFIHHARSLNKFAPSSWLCSQICLTLLLVFGGVLRLRRLCTRTKVVFFLVAHIFMLQLKSSWNWLLHLIITKNNDFPLTLGKGMATLALDGTPSRIWFPSIDVKNKANTNDMMPVFEAKMSRNGHTNA